MEVHEFKQTVSKKVCPTCGQIFAIGASEDCCPSDGALLAPVMDDPFIGQTLAENYEIETVIGAGASGTVYKARHIALVRAVAVKILQTQLVSDLDKVRRFEREAKAVSMLVHKNVVSIFDYGMMPRPYMVMEYVDGKKLDELLKLEILPFETAVDIGSQICEALQAAHDMGILHRDLKPANVMLTGGESSGYTVKILDFGLAKIMQENETFAPALTKTGEIIGSPPYMSPEQCMGNVPDKRSDIYSLACILYELFTGQRPFVCSSAAEYMTKHTMEKPRSFLEANPKLLLPQLVEDVVLKGLEKDPAKRQQSMSELKTDLQRSLVVATKSGIKTLRRKRARTKLQKLGTLAITTAAVAAGSAFIFFQCSPKFLPAFLWQFSSNAGAKAVAEKNFPAAEDSFKNAVRIAQTFGKKDPRYFSSMQQLLQVNLSESKFAEAALINDELLDLSQIEAKKRRMGGPKGRNGVSFYYPSKWKSEPGSIDWNDCGKFKPAHTIKSALFYMQVTEDKLSPEALANLEQGVYQQICSGYKLISTKTVHLGEKGQIPAIQKDYEVSGDFGITPATNRVPSSFVIKAWDTGDRILHRDVYFGIPGRTYKLRLQNSTYDDNHLKKSFAAILATVEMYPEEKVTMLKNPIQLSSAGFFRERGKDSRHSLLIVPAGADPGPGYERVVLPRDTKQAADNSSSP